MERHPVEGWAGKPVTPFCDHGADADAGVWFRDGPFRRNARMIREVFSNGQTKHHRYAMLRKFILRTDATVIRTVRISCSWKGRSKATHLNISNLGDESAPAERMTSMFALIRNSWRSSVDWPSVIYRLPIRPLTTLFSITIFSTSVSVHTVTLGPKV